MADGRGLLGVGIVYIGWGRHGQGSTLSCCFGWLVGEGEAKIEITEDRAPISFVWPKSQLSGIGMAGWCFCTDGGGLAFCSERLLGEWTDSNHGNYGAIFS